MLKIIKAFIYGEMKIRVKGYNIEVFRIVAILLYLWCCYHVWTNYMIITKN